MEEIEIAVSRMRDLMETSTKEVTSMSYLLYEMSRAMKEIASEVVIMREALDGIDMRDRHDRMKNGG